MSLTFIVKFLNVGFLDIAETMTSHNLSSNLALSIDELSCLKLRVVSEAGIDLFANV